MELRLRQPVLVARSKDAAVRDLAAVLDLHPAHGSGDLSPYGLPAKGPMSEGGRAVLEGLGVENLLFPIGSDILEVMFPTRPDGATVGFMDRRGGDTGYMIVLQTDHVDRYKSLAEKEGVRISHEATFPQYQDIHLHPRDCGGALLSMAAHLPENVPDGAWYPGGDWQARPASRAVSGIAAAELRSEDPKALAERWGRLLELPVAGNGDSFTIALEDGALRFAPVAPGQKEGFYGLDLVVRDRAFIESGASALGLAIAGDCLTLVGMTIRLV
jgi:hypothetical protein